jgi:hypothetical protein
MRRHWLLILAATLLAATLIGCDGGDDDDRDAGEACNANDDCQSDLYCKTEVGDCDGVGTCQLMPPSCPDVDQPVCGCDALTYSNSCDAAAVGVSQMSEGPCP